MRLRPRLLRILSLASSAVLLAVLSSAAAQVQPDTSIVGMWQGALNVGGIKLRIVFHVTKTDSNTLAATMDSPDQGATGIPVSKVTVSGDSVAFTVAVAGGSFEGRISGDKNSIDGKWKQNGAVLPLALNRTTTVIEFKRPQEPKPPFPYKSEEVAYENSAEGVNLAGTLTMPDSGGPFPAAILITGSGPQNRNEELLGHKPFLVIADYLTRKGIAVLRVDDRGVGGSTGSTSNSTTADFATDVLAGIKFLKSRSDINPTEIGLIGHSEGGIIAPMVASQSKDVAFIVMLAGTGLPGEDIILMQTRLIEEAGGAASDKIREDLSRGEKVYTIIKSGSDSAKIAENLRGYLKSTLPEWGADIQKNGGDPEKTIDSRVKSLDSPWFRYFLTYDPRPALEKVKCPVLAMGGTLDLQVPAKENLKEIETVLKKGGNKDFTIKLMPGLNHLFQDAKTGSPNEYAQIEETFSPAALKVIGDWIVKRTSQK